MITFTYEFTQYNNCIECKKRLGLSIASSRCIYDIEYNNIITFKIKTLFYTKTYKSFDTETYKSRIRDLTKCCGPNLIFYITPIATLHKKLLL